MKTTSLAQIFTWAEGLDMLDSPPCPTIQVDFWASYQVQLESEDTKKGLAGHIKN